MSILRPIKQTPCRYAWPGLVLQKSTEVNAGVGVFATTTLPIGTMIPILGQGVDPVTSHHTHQWNYYDLSGPVQAVVPSHSSMGLDIAMYINETTHRPYNCCFEFNYVVLVKTILTGEELFVWYGNNYEEFRKRFGYTVGQNHNLSSTHVQSWIQQLDRMQFPNMVARHYMIKYYNNLIQQNTSTGLKGRPSRT